MRFEESEAPEYQFDMMRHNDGPWSEVIPVDGATIVTAIHPIRYKDWGQHWTPVVDIFFDQLVLGVKNDTGQVQIRLVGGHTANGDIIPEEPGILSLTVSNTGAYQAFWKGPDGVQVSVLTGNTGQAFTELNPDVIYNQAPDWEASGVAQDDWDAFWALEEGERVWVTGPRSFDNYITLGRNQPDGWTAYNGLIGDTYVYGSELGEQERSALVDQTWAAMAIPEPGTIGLLGLAGLIMMIRRARLARK